MSKLTKAEAEATVQDAIRKLQAEKADADQRGGDPVIDQQLKALQLTAAVIASR